MNSIILGFIGPQEIFVIFFVLLVIGSLTALFLVALFRIGSRNKKSQWVARELENQFNKYQDSKLTQEDIRDYYPVKEGNKITLIRFDEIVDFSASNNYIFLTDINGKDYLIDSNLTELETKLPDDFIRVHKSTIVNRKLISEVKNMGNGRYDLEMKCAKKRVISCSKNYNEKIKSIIDF